MTSTPFCTQLYYFLYKNFLTKKRNPKTIAEIIVPILFILILISLRFSEINDKHVETDRIQTTYDLYHIDFWIQNKYLLYQTSTYNQSNCHIEMVMKQIKDSSLYPHHILSFFSFNDLDQYYEQHQKYFYAAVFFENVNEFGNFSDQEIKISLRFPSSVMPSTEANPITDKIWQTNSESFKYYNSGFLSLQNLLSESLIKIIARDINANPQFSFSFQEYPILAYDIPDHILSNYPIIINQILILNYLGISTVSSLGGIYINLSFILSALFSLEILVGEKSNKGYENLKIIGIDKNTIIWGQLLTYFPTILLSCIINIILFSISGFFPHCNLFVIFIFLFMSFILIQILVLIISIFFQNPKLASQTCFFSSVLFFLPSLLIQYFNLNTYAYFFICLFPQSCINIAFSNLINASKQPNCPFLFSIVDEYGSVPFYFYFIMLLIDIVIYFLLYIYLDQVFPQGYAPKKSWNFCCRWSCLFKNPSINSSSFNDNDEKEDIEMLNPNCQIDHTFYSSSSSSSLSLSHLSHTFDPNSSPAVNDFNLNLYPGNITGLLGHNGAGKTTLLSIIIGLIQPNTGNINYSDHSLSYLDDLGMCPQYNIIFQNFTVFEHLWFVLGVKNKLRNKTNADIEATIQSTLQKTALLDKKDNFVSQLSGGEKRKLNIALALCCDPNIILLDEPSASLDLPTRHSIYSLLSSLRKNHLILLSTHDMYEANLLCDRIVIMHEGSIRYIGSPLALRNHWGLGYHLYLDIKPPKKVDNNIPINDDQMIHLHHNILKFIPSASIIDFHLPNIKHYLLPLSSISSFSSLFSILEKSKEELMINHFNIEMTSLEEVFLKMEDIIPSNDSSSISNPLQSVSHPPFLLDVSNNISSFWNLISTTIKKRKVLSLRDINSLILQLILPVVYLLIAFIAISYIPLDAFSSPSPLKLSSSLFQNTENKLYYTSSISPNQVESLLSPLNLSLTHISSESLLIDTLLSSSPTYISLNVNNFNTSLLNPSINTRILVNKSHYHASPSFMNQYFNCFLTSLSSQTTLFSNSISFYNHPFLDNNSMLLSNLKTQMRKHVLSLLIALSVSFIFIGFGSSIVTEKEHKFVTLQYIMGMNPIAYWLGNLVIDFIFYLVPIMMIYILAAIFQNEILFGYNSIGVIILFLLFGYANLSFNYIFTFLFSKAETYQIFSIFLSTFCIMIAFALTITDIPYVKQIISFIPLCSFVFSINQLSLNQIMLKSSYQFCQINSIFCNFETSYFSLFLWDQIGFYLFCIFIIGSISLFLTIYFDYYHIVCNCNCFKNNNEISWNHLSNATSSSSLYNDDDVIHERQIVDNFNSNHQNIILKHLYYAYPSANNYSAVCDLSLSCKNGECLGILGPNGAGKSTLIQLLLNLLSPNYGDIDIYSLHFQDNFFKIYQMLSYCPQSDWLHPLLSVSQHIHLFALIKGVPPSSIDEVLSAIIQFFSLSNYDHKLISELSGGQKRKVSLILSVLGGRPLLILDEPTNGLDISNRHLIWDLIKKMKNKDRNIFLTTHSMEEANYLTDRVTIMINGHLVCLGTHQHLKEKFGKGYDLEIQTSPLYHQQLQDWLQEEFSLLNMMDGYQGHFRYRFTISDYPLSYIFKILEDNRETQRIIEYNISQPSLNQIFIYFSRLQDDQI